MKPTITTRLALVALVLAAPATAQDLLPGEKAAEVSAISGVVSDDAQWEIAWSGPMIADGMAAASDGSLLFAQEQSNSVIKVWPDGKWWVQWPYVAGAGAVSFDSQGRAFAAERTCTDPGLGLGASCDILPRIVQLAPERKVIAEKFADGSTLGRINDLAADGHGGAYYTQGGLFHAKADGTVDTIIAGGNPQQGGVFTNGVVLSPDGTTLYVTNRTTIIAFDVGSGGALSNRRDFATLESEPEGSFGGDGLAVDSDARLYVTGDAGVYVFDSAGKQLGIIPVPRRAITAAFAGPDRKTLYVGTLGAVTPDGEAWTTPQGVRNVAATVYRLSTQAIGVRR